MNFFLSKCLRKVGSLFLKTADKLYKTKSNCKQNNEVEITTQAIRVIPWFKDEGDKTHRLNYDLNKNSVVFDLGGYEGEWGRQIYCLYGSSIYIFEPYEKYFEGINSKFKKNEKIKIFQFGLSAMNQTLKLGIADNSSSVFINTENNVDIKLVCAKDFFFEQRIHKIDLMKINIEGGEFDLLEHLIETGDITKIKNIQVQFHDFVPDAENRMKAIQQNLHKTHELTYQYVFVWENWKLKES